MFHSVFSLSVRFDIRGNVTMSAVWHYGAIVTPWYHDTMLLWHYGIVVSWHCASL